MAKNQYLTDEEVEAEILRLKAGVSEFSYRESRQLKSLLPEYDIDYLLSEDEVRQGA